MKRSNVWRDPAGNLWEVRDGEVGYDLASYIVLADRTVWSRVARTTSFRQTVSPVAQEAWEILIGDPLPAPVKAVEGAEDVPDTYSDGEGRIWIRKEGGVATGPQSAVWVVTENGHIMSGGIQLDNRPLWAGVDARVREAWAALYPKSSRSEPPKKRPRKFRDSDGDVWIRGFARGRVLFRRYDGSLFEAYVKKGKVNYTDNRSPTPYQDDECADQVRAAIAALWPEKGSK